MYGFVYIEVIEFLLKSGNKVLIIIILFENIFIKIGLVRRNSYKSWMVRWSKKFKKKESFERRRFFFKKLVK